MQAEIEHDKIGFLLWRFTFFENLAVEIHPRLSSFFCICAFLVSKFGSFLVTLVLILGPSVIYVFLEKKGHIYNQTDGISMVMEVGRV